MFTENQRLDMPKVSFFRYRLCEWIYNNFSCCYVLHVHFLLCYYVLYKIVFDIYMLGLSMELRVFCISYSSLTITICDTPIPGVPLTTRQPVEFLWISGYPIPHDCVAFIGIHISTKKIGHSLLCSGSSTQHTTCITVIHKSLFQHSYTEHKNTLF